ncbi:MAG: hypothetical protein HKN23_06285 [Verrucomicrobiales bacterium]|nr:hypothetical protein [Verrucomicrobiales bacterium]
MNAIPNLGQFHLNSVDQACIATSRSQVSFQVNLEHDRMNQRILVGLMDENRKRGVAIAIYPATGEVCDLANGGGVIGYLSMSPLLPHESIPCEVLLYKFGHNCVCSVRVQGETFLYPAFMLDDPASLNALVGIESDNPAVNDHSLTWDSPQLSVSEIEQAA